MKFHIKKLETSLYHMVWNTFRYIEPFRRESRVWQTDRQTADRMVLSNSALHN